MSWIIDDLAKKSITYKWRVRKNWRTIWRVYLEDHWDQNRFYKDKEYWHFILRCPLISKANIIFITKYMGEFYLEKELFARSMVEITVFFYHSDFTWNLCFWELDRSSKTDILPKCVEMAFFTLSESPKLIVRKIWVIENW